MARKILDTDIPKVAALLKKVLGTEEYVQLERLGGLTNRTYHVTMADGSQYVARIPGEGTEKMIDRAAEHVSTRLACSLNIDAELLYFGPEGTKLTRWVPEAQTMTAELLRQPEEIQQMADIFRRLHSCGIDTAVPFEVFRMADNYESIIYENHVPMFPDYAGVKDQIARIKAHVDQIHPAQKVPCHNDALCANWVRGSDRLYLVDWEYAGMNDSMWDIAEVSLEAEYGDREDRMLLGAYLAREPRQEEMQHLIASKIYVDFLWTLWAKTRVPFDGQPMEDWAAERYARLKDNIRAFEAI